ncbi:hypothetical protein CRYUN_Cryun08bG0065900 [Craigia yunnanensis]
MMVATLLFPCNTTLIRGFLIKENASYPRLFLGIRERIVNQHPTRYFHVYQNKRLSRGFLVFAATEGSAKSSKSKETVPSWARPDSNEPPPWARDEGKEYKAQQSFEIPFYVYLLASAVTAIAAVCFLFLLYNGLRPTKEDVYTISSSSCR